MKETLREGVYSGFDTERQASRYAIRHVDRENYDYEILWSQADCSWSIHVY